MAKDQPSANHKPHISEKARQRPVRVIPSDDRAEMEAGHLIAGGGVFSSNMLVRSNGEAREGFGPERAFTAGFGGDFGSSAAEANAEDAGDGAVGGSFESFTPTGDPDAVDAPDSTSAFDR